MSKDTSITPLPSTQLIVAEPTTGDLLRAVIDKGVTAESVGVVERLVALKERQEEREAERHFAEAFAALQAELPTIETTKPVPDKHGNIKYHFAPFEEIMRVVRPYLLKRGFSVTFSADFKEGRIFQTCTLMHIKGHSRSNVFMARIGGGPPGASEAQADGAASTYAKRFALCNALNLVTGEPDTDARIEGEPISFDKALFLREQVKETGSDEAAFLRFAGANTYEEIGEARYDTLVRALEAKKRK